MIIAKKFISKAGNGAQGQTKTSRWSVSQSGDPDLDLELDRCKVVQRDLQRVMRYLRPAISYHGK